MHGFRRLHRDPGQNALRSESHRLSAPGRHPHRAVRVGVCASPRRPVHPAHRGHRRRALDAGRGAGDPRRAWPGSGSTTTRARIFQMQRMDRYRAVIDDMLARGLAYRDYMTAGGARCAARRADGARREAALRRPLAAGARRRARPRPPASTPVIRFRNPDDGHGRAGTTASRAGSRSQQRARRPGDRAPRRHADVQLLRGRRRLRHADHARDPRRRSRQQHAAADQHLPRARRRRRRGTRTCPPSWATTARSCPSATARVGVTEYDAARLPAGGDDQFSRAPRLGAWRRRDRSRATSWSRGSTCRASAPRRHASTREAALGEPGAHEAHDARGSWARASCRTSLRAGLDAGGGAGSGRRRRAAARPRRNAGRDGRRSVRTSTRRQRRHRARLAEQVTAAESRRAGRAARSNSPPSTGRARTWRRAQGGRRPPRR